MSNNKQVIDKFVHKHKELNTFCSRPDRLLNELLNFVQNYLFRLTHEEKPNPFTRVAHQMFCLIYCRSLTGPITPLK